MLAGEQITLERTRVPLIYFTLTHCRWESIMPKKPNEDGFATANDAGRDVTSKNVVRLFPRSDGDTTSIAIGANVTPRSTRPTSYELTDDDDDPGPSAA